MCHEKLNQGNTSIADGGMQNCCDLFVWQHMKLYFYFKLAPIKIMCYKKQAVFSIIFLQLNIHSLHIISKHLVRWSKYRTQMKIDDVTFCITERCSIHQRMLEIKVLFYFTLRIGLTDFFMISDKKLRNSRKIVQVNNYYVYYLYLLYDVLVNVIT